MDKRICVYPAGETDFASNGLGCLSPTRCRVHWAMDGEYELEIEHPIDLGAGDWGKYERLCAYGRTVVAPVPEAPSMALRQTGATATVSLYAIATRKSRLRLRSGPGTSYRCLGYYAKGRKVTLLNKTSADWYEVTAPDGKHGWMAARYLTAAGTQTVSSVTTEILRDLPMRPQPFDIYAFDPGLSAVTARARHVFWRLAENLVCELEIKDKTAQQALDAAFAAALNQSHGFHWHCEDTEKRSMEKMTGRTLADVILGDGGICETYGLHLLADWFDVFLVKELGARRGVQLRYGKNVTGLSGGYDISNVVTRVVPVGQTRDGKPLYRSGNRWVASTHESLYPRAIYRQLDVSEAKVGSEVDGKKLTAATARTLMDKRARELLDSGCDLPDCSLTAKMAQLRYDPAYEDYAALERVCPGDTLGLFLPDYGLTLDAALSEYTFDAISQRYEDLTLGSPRQNLSSSGVTSRQLGRGAVTGSKLAYASVGASALAAGAVSTPHLQADSINAQALQAGSVTTEKLTAGSVTTEKLDAAAVTAEKLAAGSVTAEKLHAGSVSADKLEAGSVTAEKLAAAAVTAEKLAAGSVSADKLEAGSVTTEKLHASAVTADKLAAGSVTTDKLRAGAVTAEKIASKTITSDLIAAKTITADSGVIDDAAIGGAQIADGSITAAKIVSLNADVITTGTLSAERLVLVGDDGVIYKINVASSGLSLTELQKDQYKNYINGTVIVAKSITAAQIAAQSITGNEILAGSVTAKEIDVSDLFASEATINALNAMDIRGNKYLQLYVTDKVDNISVGGRNLLRGTNQGAANWNWSMQTGGKTVEEYLDGGVRAVKMTRDAVEQTGWSVITYAVSEDTYALLEPNTEYTLSFDYKPSVATANGIMFAIKKFTGADAASGDGGYWKEIPANEWTHVSGQFTTAEEIPAYELNSYCVYITRVLSAVNSVHILKNLKLEKGNKSTDWSPAPEDTSSAIEANTAAINLTKESITSLVTKVDGISIGGRNLLTKAACKGSPYYAEDASWRSGYGVTLLTTSDNPTFQTSNLNGSGAFIIGETYTLSFTAKADGATNVYTDLFPDTISGIFGNAQREVTTTPRKIVITGVLTSSADLENVYLRFWRMPSEPKFAIQIWDIKLEKGNKATDWSPAPEDIDGDVSALEQRMTTAESKIDQKADSITLSVLETKVDNISVGGRNLLRGTNQGAANWDWSMQTGGKTIEEYLDGGVHAVKMTRDATPHAGWSVISYAISKDAYALLEPNTEYTLSFDYKPSVATANGVTFSIRRGDGSNAATNDGGYWKEIPANEWTHVSGTFMTVENIPNFLLGSTEIYITRLPTTVNSIHIFKNLKLEKGNKSTDWSPAPEDPAGSLSVSSDYSRVEITKNQVKIVSREMEVAVPSDDGEDDVLRVDADGVHAEVVEADVIVSESVVRTQGAASYTPANAGELAAILEELRGKHLTGDVSIDCANVTSGSYTIQGLSGEGRLQLQNGRINNLEIKDCGSTVVHLSRVQVTNSAIAVSVNRSLMVYMYACTLNAGVGIDLGAEWPAQATSQTCTGDCTIFAKLNYNSRLCCIGTSKPTGTVSVSNGGEVYNATSDPTFAAKSDPSIPTTQTVTVSLSPTQTYTLRGTSNSDENKLYQGRYSSSQPLRKGVMLFTLPTDLTSAGNIDSATLTLKRIGGVGQGGGVSVQVRCYDVPGTLYASKTAYDGQTVSIDVTSAVKAMKTNGYGGLMLYNPDTTTVGSKPYTASYARFAGKGESGAPVLKVSYRK